MNALKMPCKLRIEQNVLAGENLAGGGPTCFLPSPGRRNSALPKLQEQRGHAGFACWAGLGPQQRTFVANSLEAASLQVTAGLAPPEALLLGTWMVVSSCVLVPLSLWVYLCPLLFLQGRWSSWIRPTLAIAFYLNHLCKGPIPNQSHSDLLGFRTPADEFREWDTVQSTAPGVLGHRAIMGNPSGGESRPPTS